MYTLIIFIILLIGIITMIVKSEENYLAPVLASMVVGIVLYCFVSLMIGTVTPGKITKTSYDLQIVDKNFVICTDDIYVIRINDKNMSLDFSNTKVCFTEEKPRLERLETVSRSWFCSWGFEANDKVSYVLYLNQ